LPRAAFAVARQRRRRARCLTTGLAQAQAEERVEPAGKELAMPAIKTIGFPRMQKEPGEKRVFLPDFVQWLVERGLTIFLEEGYGSRSGYTFDDYQQGQRAVRWCTRQQAYRQEMVMVLRSPMREEFDLLRPGHTLVSMLHFPTRPRRVARLHELGINAISLDGLTNDNNLRVVEDMKAVAWNGLEVAFDALEQTWPGLRRPDGQPIRVLVLGTGMVGKHAVDAASKLGNVERNNQHIEAHGPGSLALCVGRNVTEYADTMRTLFQQADILVDATQRRDTSRPVVPNAWLAWLPEHAVIADLAVDPYTPEVSPPVVRGIEGIPQGNLDKYLFHPDDADWGKTIPAGVRTEHRRRAVSCYSWPGIHPEASMRHYAQQLKPLLEVLFERGYEAISPQGRFFERALYRGSLKGWIESTERASLLPA
jgi:alanine dehydrogenase